MHQIKGLNSALILFLAVFIGFADNPIIQTNYTADPAPMVYDGKVYLYTSHDDDVTVNDFYTMRNYCCYSSSDMANWTDHGIVATLNEFKWLNGHNNDAWAPQCVERNGKFYLYIPIHGKGMGVQVADSPTGPFTDPVGKALINRGNWSDIDPTVFVDTDGQAYMYWGNGSLWYVKLNEDMTSYSGSIVTINPKPTGFTEGPWMYKRNDLYYMVYAGMGNGTENIQYATSSSSTGPWTSKGIIIPHGRCFTNHPGICDFEGNSYFFYHNSALSNHDFKRSVCLEQFDYEEDGSIPSIATSKDGPEQIGSLNPYDTVQAETICWSEGVKTETCNEGGLNITSIENNDYIKVKGVDFGAGATLFEARVASNTGGGEIELRLGSQNGTLIGTCTINGTGGDQSWATEICTVNGANGKHDLFLKFTGGSSSLFKLNWWRFQGSTGTYPGAVSKFQKSEIMKIVNKDANSALLLLQLPETYSPKSITATISDLQGRLITKLSSGKHSSGMVTFFIDKKFIRSSMYIVSTFSGKKLLFSNCHIF